MVRCCSVAPCCCAAAPRRVACKLTNPALPAQLAFVNKKKPQATPPRMHGVSISSFFVKKPQAAHGLQLIGARSNEAVRIAGARNICGMIARRGLASKELARVGGERGPSHESLMRPADAEPGTAR